MKNEGTPPMSTNDVGRESKWSDPKKFFSFVIYTVNKDESATKIFVNVSSINPDGGWRLPKPGDSKKTKTKRVLGRRPALRKVNKNENINLATYVS